MNIREFYKSKIDEIAKESFNNEQKILAKGILDSVSDDLVESTYQLISQRVKTGFVFDAAPEINHDAISLVIENEGMFISSPDKTIDYIEYKLIIGENYDALKNLIVTYVDPTTNSGLIDLIYIDPPYGTENAKNEGNSYKEEVKSEKFIYRDKYTRDGWLNLLNERLVLSKKLLKDDGLIFISIDNRNQAYLKVLMDEVYGENNFLGNIAVVNNLKGRSDDEFFATSSEYLIVYAKDISKVSITGIPLTDEEIETEYDKSDNFGPYKWVGLRKTGKGWQREERPFMYYPILKKDDEFYSITREEYDKIFIKEQNQFDDTYVDELIDKYTKLGYEAFLPLDTKGNKGRWRWGFDTFNNEMKINVECNTANTPSSKMRISLEDGAERLKSHKTTWYKSEYDSGSAGGHLNKILDTKDQFDNPKSVIFIKDIINLIDKKDAIILDFFAGSGTTGQAVMELNIEDGGKRQFVLVTNNENNIGKDITWERLYRNIKGVGSNNQKIEWKYNNETPSFIDNELRVFDIQQHELTIDDTSKAAKLVEESVKQFKLLNQNYSPKSELDIYNELSSLNPAKKVEE